MLRLCGSIAEVVRQQYGRCAPSADIGIAARSSDFWVSHRASPAPNSIDPQNAPFTETIFVLLYILRNLKCIELVSI
jgi:hypothetical protein